MSRCPVSAPDDGDRGAALVEFSVVLGLLLYLILGAVSFGVILAATHQLNEAAGESARTAALEWNDPSTTLDDRIERARESLEASGVDCGSAALSCTITIHPCGGEPALECATVEVVHDRAVDSMVGRIPLLDRVLPDTVHATATVMVNP